MQLRITSPALRVLGVLHALKALGNEATREADLAQATIYNMTSIGLGIGSDGLCELSRQREKKESKLGTAHQTDLAP